MPPINPVAFEGWLDRIAAGEAIKAIFRSDGVEPRDFWRYLDENSDAASRYAMAMQVRTELMAEEVVAISDDPDLHPNRARNMMDSRRWLTSKHNPQKYGDRLDLNVNHTVDLSQAIADARAHALPMRCQPEPIEAEYTEESTPCLPTPADNKSAEPAKEAEKPLPDLFD